VSKSSTSAGARVVQVAGGLESTERPVPVRDRRHDALSVLIGKWIYEGHTVAGPDVPSVPILTSDVTSGRRAGFSSFIRPTGGSAIRVSEGGDNRSDR
jgi:hypothetical protein